MSVLALALWLSAGPCDSETTPAQMGASAGYVYRSARTRALGSEMMACVCGMGCTRQPSRSGYFGGETQRRAPSDVGKRINWLFASPLLRCQSHPFPSLAANQSLNNNNTQYSSITIHPPTGRRFCVSSSDFPCSRSELSQSRTAIPGSRRWPDLAGSTVQHHRGLCIRATVPPISFQNVSRTSLHSCIV